MAPGPEQQRREPVSTSLGLTDKSILTTNTTISITTTSATIVTPTITTSSASSLTTNNSTDKKFIVCEIPASLLIDDNNEDVNLLQAEDLNGVSTTTTNDVKQVRDDDDVKYYETRMMMMMMNKLRERENNSEVYFKCKEEPATLSTLNEGELRALLDEAITYKCPKDREGKSNLFKELLEEAEADESEEGRWTVTNSRCLPGSNRRRNKRDTVSERLTHGGSLQNLAQPLNSEFDNYTYLTSGSNQSYAAGRKKGNKKHSLPSVSARQREGGSLPSNVNASHTLNSVANFDLAFDKKKVFFEEKSIRDWSDKEHSKSSLSAATFERNLIKKEDSYIKEKDKKDYFDSDCDRRNNARGKIGTNEMLESENPPPEYNNKQQKPDCMVLDLEDFEASVISDRNASAALSGTCPRPRSSLDTEEEEGTEMKTIENRRPTQFITRATFDIPQIPVDTPLDLPTFREHTSKLEKSKINVNGTEGTGSLPFAPYNNVKCVMSSGPSSVYSVMPWPPNISMGTKLISEAVSRITAQHIASKDSLASEKKTLDENGNAVQGHSSNGDSKKSRRKKTQEPNVIVYQAENVKGHRDDEDIDVLISFIENKECKGKKGKTGGGGGGGGSGGNSVNKFKTASSSSSSSNSSKSRTRDKDCKREEIASKLQKANSYEEISKTKLEDLTTEQNTTFNGCNTVLNQIGPVNVGIRRVKQRSTGDDGTSTSDCRGDRRSWGTEEGQSIYCNDTGDDSPNNSRRNITKKSNPDNEIETEFHVVTSKKKKTKKQQRRSCSGGRAQNSASGLQRSRGFSNEYRTPLSPELRRISASSMPPSDKSDSSDLDSVHSLPVTSNSSKNDNLSISGTPQASYAEIARMANINVVTNSASNTSQGITNVMNTSTWPSVSSKNSHDTSEKITNDYYPSLDELQHTDRKNRQHNLSQSTDKSPSSPSSSSSMKISKSPHDSNSKLESQQFTEEDSNTTSKNESKSSSPNITNNPLPPDSLESNSEEITKYSSNTNSKSNVSRSRIHEEQTRELKKALNFQGNETHSTKSTITILNQQEDSDLNKKTSNTLNAAAGPSEIIESSKTKNISGKSVQQQRVSERTMKASKEQQVVHPKETLKTQKEKHSKESENMENKKSKQSNPVAKEQPNENIVASKVRPAVILLDENTDQIRNSDSPSEFTFGFEINEQLLQSEEEVDDDEEETNPDLSRFSTSPPTSYSNSHGTTSIICDKFTHQNIQMHSSSFMSTHHHHHHPMHQTPQLIVSGMPYGAYQAQYVLPHQQASQVIEKCVNSSSSSSQSKDDFSARYVAPDDNNVQHYNHDKIVTFVGLAWDDVMREMPSVSSPGRVQYYSGDCENLKNLVQSDSKVCK